MDGVTGPANDDENGYLMIIIGDFERSNTRPLCKQLRQLLEEKAGMILAQLEICLDGVFRGFLFSNLWLGWKYLAERGAAMNTVIFAVTCMLMLSRIVPTWAQIPTECRDQVHEPAGMEYLYINGTISIAQTFTAGSGGRLTSVDLLVGRYGNPAGPLIVEVRPTTTGTPAEDPGSAMASMTIPAAEINGFNYVSLNLSSVEIEVQPGDVLAIVARSPGSGSSIANDFYAVIRACGSPYAGGLAFFQAFEPSWQVHTDSNGATCDYGFHTYLDCATGVEARTWSEVKALF